MLKIEAIKPQMFFNLMYNLNTIQKTIKRVRFIVPILN